MSRRVALPSRTSSLKSRVRGGATARPSGSRRFRQPGWKRASQARMNTPADSSGSGSVIRPSARCRPHLVAGPAGVVDAVGVLDVKQPVARLAPALLAGLLPEGHAVSHVSAVRSSGRGHQDEERDPEGHMARFSRAGGHTGRMRPHHAVPWIVRARRSICWTLRFRRGAASSLS